MFQFWVNAEGLNYPYFKRLLSLKEFSEQGTGKLSVGEFSTAVSDYYKRSVDDPALCESPTKLCALLFVLSNTPGHIVQ